MYRKVTVQLTVKLIMLLDEGLSVQDVVDEMEYQFILPEGATFNDSEILDFEVKDSR